MPKMKQMIKRTKVEIAKGKRTCKFSKTKILKGQACLVVYDGPREYSCYSRDVALKMIEKAHDELEKIKMELSCG